MTESIVEHNDAAQEHFIIFRGQTDVMSVCPDMSMFCLENGLLNAQKFKAARHLDNNPNSYWNGNYW